MSYALSASSKNFTFSGTEIGLFVVTLVLVCAFICCFSYYCFKMAYVRQQQHSKCKPDDLKYIQQFMQSVGRCLSEPSVENLTFYKELAADIYRHIPSKHWGLIEQIDQSITSGNIVVAWDKLKLLSQSFASDEIKE